MKYLDLDLNFKAHPVTKDVTKKVDDSAVFTSLKNLIKTANFERPFHPEIGCQVYSLLFEQMTPEVISSVSKTIKYVVENFEPRVELLSINVTPSSSALLIDLEYRIIELNTIRSARFEIERTV